ncbi:2-amino-4-hydroxy-6-hydroxymethyldihydropteridine diphosphokinase [Brevibacillus massiliensis]|jgi:2-amino-4-hydroxy-6-hydroxymethyldihydropteridine diphosphokinase|uniref:2-amino-4-hydroxy-6- hydroxymethyldihydropteridine diphosphokinase n=1 Tax=Brevibacillus massiliensis TaxID=1118054 RepID=UPI0003064D3E|nr:2-amino-4-hydroxy-6-hydroxymethyldihydropteridine diphosphokinase [Brevibacillus massiliensis]
MSVLAYLALGSNLGQRAGYLAEAVRALQKMPEITVTAVSAIYETDPVGYLDQPAFLNMALAVQTVFSPLDLLAAAMQIEGNLGRERHIHWGPRTIDIDILLYGRESVQLPSLRIPHPAMLNRAFVLIPLRDVLQENTPPFEHKSIDKWIAEADDVKGVRKWGMLDWATGYGPSGS